MASYQCDNGNFPAFYTRTSGCKVPYNLDTPKEAAQMIYTASELNLNSGFLIGVPIPTEYAMDKAAIDCAIENALNDAKINNVGGKEVTPFILSAVAQLTKGRSLESSMHILFFFTQFSYHLYIFSSSTDIALIKNNAKVAAEIAVELNELENVGKRDGGMCPEQITNSRKESSGVDYDENITNVPVS